MSTGGMSSWVSITLLLCTFSSIALQKVEMAKFEKKESNLQRFFFHSFKVVFDLCVEIRRWKLIWRITCDVANAELT